MIAPAPANNASMEPLFDKKSAAAFLGCGIRTLDKMTADGVVTAVKLGWLVRFDPSDLRALVESRKSGKRRPKAKQRRKRAVAA
ncbi:MAG TPA: helix-turn-helix domain-containing protein [Pirellulaceae bacterium]|jgi:excisionase family DNA binding protein